MNEVLLQYYSSGQALRDYQEHAGAKDGSAPYVKYNRDTSYSSGTYTKGLRLKSVQYPNGRLVHYTYDTTGTTADVLLVRSPTIVEKPPAEKLAAVASDSPHGNRLQIAW